MRCDTNQPRRSKEDCMKKILLSILDTLKSIDVTLKRIERGLLGRKAGNESDKSMFYIKSDGVISEMYRNGEKLKDIRAVSFSHDPNKGFPKLEIELMPGQVEIDTRIVPELPEFYKPFYTKKNELN